MGIVQNPQIAQNSDDDKKTQVRYIPATTEIPLGGEIKYSLIHGEDFEKYDMPGVSELFNFLSQIPEVLSMISPYWISGTTYNVSDMKIYNNKLYICNKKHVAGNDNFPDTSQFWKNIVYEESIHSYINDIRNGIYEYVNSIIHTHDYSKDIRVSADGLRKFVEENTKRQMRIVELNINVGKKEAKTYTDKQNSNQYNKLISEIHAAETRAKNHIHTIFKDEYDILLEKQIHGDQVQKTYTDTREGIIRRDTENNLTKAIDETITHSDNEDHKLDRKLSDKIQDLDNKTSDSISITKTELTNEITNNANRIDNNRTYHTNVRNNDYNHFTSEDARIEKKLYPIGSIYFNYSNSTNPSSLLGLGTWSALPANYFLAQAGNRYSAGGTYSEGLPNIAGTINENIVAHSKNYDGRGALRLKGYDRRGGPDWNNHSLFHSDLIFDASRSNDIYGRANAVRPYTLGAYMWRRIA